ncbi:hypothetical protein IAR55_001132 [Kwoniella newhampshirensis]|uniref:Pentatricopeptide repeat protein n=1 Tax=Kwoniella newhampshirensis TaxID=1651941 RepID=A0AAW0Z4W0_9TREE
MLRSFHQNARLLRQSSTSLIRASSIPLQSLREYHGDPGPSSISNRREQQLKLRQAAALGEQRNVRVAGRDVLDNLLDTPSLNPRPTSLNQPRPVQQKRTSRPERHDRTPRSSADASGHTRKAFSGRSDSTSATPRYRRPATPYETREDNPYTTSTRLRRWIAKHSGQISPAETEEVIAMVAESPKHMVNAPVYNILLGYIGRQKKLDRMWKLYNEMKKRGVKPTSRTYSTMLNAYAGVSHSHDISDVPIRAPEERTLSRVTILFEHAQAHIKACIARQASINASVTKDDLGLAAQKSKSGQRPSISGKEEVKSETGELAEEIDLSPTNAYLKFLGRHGLWEEMQRVFAGMDLEGSLAPDTVTYTTMFGSLYHVYRARERERENGKITLAIGPTAKGLWDQCVRQYTRKSNDSSAGNKGKMMDQTRQLDNVLLTHVLRCLLRGRPEDQRLATSLVNEIWSLPSPGQTTLSSSDQSTASSSNLPKLNIDVKAATSLINLLSSIRKPTLATHFTLFFLSMPTLKDQLDLPFLNSAIRVLSETGDVQAILSIIESYQPPTGAEGWPVSTWKAALTSARWAGDYTSAVQIFRRATHLSEGAETTDPRDKSNRTRPYLWSTPNRQARDVRGVLWARSRPIPVDAQLMSILLKTGMQKSNKEIKEVLSIYRHLGGEGRFFVFPRKEEEHDEGSGGGKLYLRQLLPSQVDVTDKMRRDLENKVELAKELERAVERVNGVEFEYLREGAKEVVEKWGRVVERRDHAIGKNSSRSDRVVDSVPERDDDEVEAAPRAAYVQRGGRGAKLGDDGKGRSMRTTRDFDGDRARRSYNDSQAESKRKYRDRTEHQPRRQFISRSEQEEESLENSRGGRTKPEASRPHEASKNFVYRPRGTFGRRRDGVRQ